ncbi:undecaprenyl-diphosphate phosphatase [Pantoea sp. 1.19]|uniref:undecaprenyl-diphosphate phosphatase n=1 Tax=Pantoea sp. 1.19 TaxID=1925589 RepID=UPI00094905E4|nr:undecaprenyl-diphosphate phosphatase [Pantoea sp. 1.19]
MEALNQKLFLWINATPDSPGWLIALATFIARDAIAIVPMLIAALWLWGTRHRLNAQRELVLKTAIALVYALLISWCLGSLFPHPRPFVAGIGHQFLSHAPDYSYPSDHGTTMFTVALAFLCWHRLWSGLTLLAVAIAIAWSRIYLGVHWPLDMLGGLLVGMLGCLFAQVVWLFGGTRLLRLISSCYRTLFSLLIRKGWVKE